MDASLFDWHSLSALGEGIGSHTGTKYHTAYVRKFQGMDSMVFKPMCFHPLTKACTCNAPRNPRSRRGNGPSNARDGELRALAEARALMGKCPCTARACSSANQLLYYCYSQPRLALRFNKIWTARFTQEWNDSRL